jgi:hypothetical protein
VKRLHLDVEVLWRRLVSLAIIGCHLEFVFRMDIEIAMELRKPS